MRPPTFKPQKVNWKMNTENPPRKRKRKFWERIVPVIKTIGEIVISILTLKKK